MKNHGSVPVDGAAESSRGASVVLLNGIRVLQAFSLEEPVLGVTEIAHRVDLHKSTVSRILTTLEHERLVERDSASGRFRLGLGVIGLAGPLLANLDVRRVAYSALEELMERTQETAALMVWGGFEAISVEQVPSPRQVKHTSLIGTRYTTVASASVQVFLAYQPEATVRSLFDRSGQTHLEPVNVKRYLARLREVREKDYAINDGETSSEEVGVAAPVRDHRNDVIAAILLSAPRFRVPHDLLLTYAEAVRDKAREVSERLGSPAQ